MPGSKKQWMNSYAIAPTASYFEYRLKNSDAELTLNRGHRKRNESFTQTHSSALPGVLPFIF